jgi:hypothetical protein
VGGNVAFGIGTTNPQLVSAGSFVTSANDVVVVGAAITVSSNTPVPLAPLMFVDQYCADMWSDAYFAAKGSSFVPNATTGGVTAYTFIVFEVCFLYFRLSLHD